MRLPSSVLGSAEVALNRALESTPAAAAVLSKWGGRRLRIVFSPPEMAFDLLVTSATVMLLQAEDEDDAPETTVTGSPGDLMLALASGQGMGRMQVTGDSEFAGDMFALLRTLNWDWEAWLSSLLPGNQLGMRLVEGLRRGGRWLTRNAGTLELDAAEFLAEESRDLVGRNEVATFNDDVDQLRLAADRLQARIGRLRGTGSAGSEAC